MHSTMRRLLRGALRVLVLGLLGGYLISCLILYLGQERMLFHPTVIARDFVFPFTPAFSEIFLPVDGATLSMVYFKQPAAKGVVLYLHGNGSTLQSADFFADRFLRRGYDAMLLDYRGYGKSTGAISSEEALHQDAQAAYGYLRQTYREDQIIVYGESLGSGLAVQLAATTAPRMVILESAYLSMRDLVAREMPFVPLFLLKYQLRSDQLIGKVRCPIYLFHGTQDSVIPFDSSQRLQAYITAPSRLIPIVGGEHSNLVAFETYQAQLDQILR